MTPENEQALKAEIKQSFARKPVQKCLDCKAIFSASCETCSSESDVDFEKRLKGVK